MKTTNLHSPFLSLLLTHVIERFMDTKSMVSKIISLGGFLALSLASQSCIGAGLLPSKSSSSLGSLAVVMAVHGLKGENALCPEGGYGCGPLRPSTIRTHLADYHSKTKKSHQCQYCTYSTYSELSLSKHHFKHENASSSSSTTVENASSEDAPVPTADQNLDELEEAVRSSSSSTIPILMTAARKSRTRKNHGRCQTEMLQDSFYKDIALKDVDGFKKSIEQGFCVCMECSGKSFHTYKDLYRHLKNNHLKNKKEYQCSACTFSTPYCGIFTRHRIESTGHVPVKNTVKRKSPASSCDPDDSDESGHESGAPLSTKYHRPAVEQLIAPGQGAGVPTTSSPIIQRLVPEEACIEWGDDLLAEIK